MLDTPAAAVTIPPLGTYLTDERRLVQVIQSSSNGVLAEDAGDNDRLIALEPDELRNWRRVQPAAM